MIGRAREGTTTGGLDRGWDAETVRSRVEALLGDVGMSDDGTEDRALSICFGGCCGLDGPGVLTVRSLECIFCGDTERS